MKKNILFDFDLFFIGKVSYDRDEFRDDAEDDEDDEDDEPDDDEDDDDDDDELELVDRRLVRPSDDLPGRGARSSLRLRCFSSRNSIDYG